MDVLQFILVADTSRARHLRRLLAEQATHVGVMVGTFTSLINTAQDAYLLPSVDIDWDSRFPNSLREIDGFWSESYLVAPEETSYIVKQALIDLITALPVSSNLETSNPSTLDIRPQQHIADLLLLYQSLGKKLDDEHEGLRECILAEKSQAIRSIKVQLDSSVRDLSLWQKTLIDKLNSDSYEYEEYDCSEFFSSTSSCSEKNSLSILQSRLFEEIDARHPLDQSLQFVSVRDYLEEADVAAGMAQQMLKVNSELSEKDIGILIPDDFEYSLAVDQSFSRAGLRLSGFSLDEWRRDLAHEAIFHFLYCRQKP
ncbi:MAG: hypothetical protein V2I33_01135, partial [Kangiellaceae bacterium]|nr:hypothetical protein [Kangiellaceae bacterium]